MVTKRVTKAELWHRFLVLALVIIFGSSWAFVVWTRTEKAYNTENLIRLHVVANSDSEEDQALKYRVRDRVLREITPLVKNTRSGDQARRVINENLDSIAAAVQGVITEAGRPYSTKVILGRFLFPAKSYGTFVLPAGEYEALRVVIGAGKGDNWWCVLFPPICFLDVSGGTATFHREDQVAGKKSGVLPVRGDNLRRVLPAEDEGARPGTDLILEEPGQGEKTPPELRFAFLDWLQAFKVPRLGILEETEKAWEEGMTPAR